MLLAVHIFSFLITIYLKKLIGIKSHSVKQCPAELSLNYTPYISHLTFWIVRESRSEAKKMLIFCTRKIPLTKEQFLYNHPIQTLFIVAVIAVILLFLTSDFMYTNIMLIFINRCLLNLIFSMEKALNGQNSSK